MFGTPDVVKARLTEIATDLRVDEVAIVTPTHDPADRRHSYTLLAETFQLRADPVALAAD